MRITKKEVIISILIVLILAIVIYSINYFTQEKPQFSSPCGECTEWQNDTCGFGICTSLEMRQSRNCTGEIPDISITPKDDFITNSPPRYSPIDPTCIKRCVFMPTVCNTPPGITLTSPENLATNISLLPELMWQGSDEPEDNQMLTYDIYLDTNPDPQILISENQTDEKYTLQTELSPSTIYYWKVVVKDGFHETESVIWQFTTEQGAISISVSLSDTFILF